MALISSDLSEYVKNIKTEFRLTSLDLSHRIKVRTDTIKAWENQEIFLDELSLIDYRKLIVLKKHDRNYPYLLFTKHNPQKNLIESFSCFIKGIMKEKNISLERLAKETGKEKAYLGQCSDSKIHPDLIEIGFLKKLLQLEGKTSDTKINNYFASPIVNTVFLPYEIARFSQFVRKLLELKNVSQKELGAQIGITGSNIGQYARGEIHPDRIRMGTFRQLANIRGWTAERLLSYIYNLEEDERETYEYLLEKTNKLSLLPKLKLISNTIDSSEKILIYHSMEEFSQILGEFLERENLTLEEATTFLRIEPLSRLTKILDRQALPTKTDLMRLASNVRFLKPDSDLRWSYEELYDSIFAKFNPSTVLGSGSWGL